jgi:hypothetical protein
MADRCDVCRARIKSYDRTCPACGAAVTNVVELIDIDTPTPALGPEPSKPRPPRRRTGLVIAIAVVALVLGASVMRTVTNRSESPRAAAPTTTAPPAPTPPVADAAKPTFYASLDPLERMPVQLAVVSGGVLHIVSTDAADVTVGPGYAPQWSPTRNWLAFRRGADAIWIVARDGSHERLVGEGTSFAWSPVADRLVVAGDQGVVFALPISGPELFDGRATSSVVWSDDGTRFAYAVDGHLIVADPTGPRQDISVAGIVTPVGWNQSSGVLAWLGGPTDSIDAAADGLRLVAIDTGNSQVRDVGTTLPYPDWIAPSPSRTQLAFVSGAGRDATTGKLLEVCDASTFDCSTMAGHRQLLDPAWSPDGRVLAVTASHSALCNLCLATVSSGALDMISGSNGAVHPLWLTDDRHVLALKDDALWLFDTAQFGAPVLIAGPVSIGDDPGALTVEYDGHTDLGLLVAVG